MNPKYLTNLQLSPYPNTQLDLFCNDSSTFCCTAPKYMTNSCVDPSTWLQTPTKKIVGCKVPQFIHTMKIKKMLSHKTLRCKYTATSSRERDELGQELRLMVTICLNRVCSMLVQLVYHLTALKKILLYV